MSTQITGGYEKSSLLEASVGLEASVDEGCSWGTGNLEASRRRQFQTLVPKIKGWEWPNSSPGSLSWFPGWRVQWCQASPETGPDMQNELQGTEATGITSSLEACGGGQGGTTATVSA